MFDLSVLKTGVAIVTFLKKDGTERVMKCTQNTGIIPENMHPMGTGPAYTENQVRVFDVEKQEWRSFRKDSITGIA